MRALFLASISLLVLLGCDTAEPPAEETVETVAQTEPPALIPRTELFGNPVKFQGRISPDGKWFSWLAPHEGVMNIHVAPVDSPDDVKVITFDKGQGIPIHYWSFTNTHVYFTQDKDGDENDRVYSVNIETGETKNLTPVEAGVRARIEGISKNKPDSLLIGINDRNPQLFDLYEMTISTGEAKLVAENPGYINWLADNNLTPRLAIRPQPTGGLDVVKIDSGDVLYTIQAGDAFNSFPLSFNKDNTLLYALSSEGRNTSALISIELATGKSEVLAEDGRADISDIIVDPVTEEVIGYATNYKTTVWYGIDDATQKELETVDAAIPGEKQFLASTADGNTLVIYADVAEKPGVYYLYDRANATATELFETRPALNDDSLEAMYPVEIPSRDGLTLVSYLTLPAGAERDENGMPTEPHPMVLNVHGGPWARDAYGYNGTHQWLANRGYAVLSVNYRGSTGFGKEFTNAAVKEFAGKMHDDLIDGVSWAVENGITTKDQVAIMGGSYGGYATLVGLTFTPDVFACGVDIVGPSSLVTLIESFPAYWGPSLQFTWYKYVGNPADESARADMFNRSPISRVGDIEKPLLIGQGENDPRVTKLESDQLVAAMDEKNLPVTYLNFPDEGHGFARPENRMAFFSTTEAFLSTCLGGRYEEIGEDFAGSSVQVLHGANYVPGVEDALKTLDSGE